MHPADERDPGLARERTALAWRRTSLTHLVSGVLIVRILETTTLRVAVGVLAVAAAALAALPLQRHGRWRLASVAAATVAVAVVGVAEVA